MPKKFSVHDVLNGANDADDDEKETKNHVGGSGRGGGRCLQLNSSRAHCPTARCPCTTRTCPALTLPRQLSFSDQQVVGWGRAEWEKAKADGAVSEEAFQDAISRGEFKADDGALPHTQVEPQRPLTPRCGVFVRRVSLQDYLLEVSPGPDLLQRERRPAPW